MKFKQLTWTDFQDGSISDDTIPQMLYRVVLAWNVDKDHREYELLFIHGYVRKPTTVGRFETVEMAKMYAQLHFEDYITKAFFE